MALADEKPEVEAPEGAEVHLYRVPGGRSCIIWDRATIDSQRPKDRYDRLALAAPVTVGVPVAQAGADYTVYDFYDDTMNQVRSTPDARVSVSEGSSCDIFYIGQTSDPDFAKTLKDVRDVRAKIQEAVVARGVSLKPSL
jgi:hypothetical protein